MAWTNIAQEYPTGSSLDYSYCETSVNSANAPRPSGFSFYTTFSVSDKTWQELNGYYVFGNSSYGIQIYDTRASGTYGAEGYLRLWNNGSSIENIGGGRLTFKNSSRNAYATCLYCFINEETQKGTIVVDNMNIVTWANPQKFCNANTLNNSAVYNFLKHYAPVLYNWQSVPSISGKNGILLMPTLSDTNNGNPVTGASSSAFTKAPSSANNIRNLVDLTLEPTNTDDSVTIFYTIPDGTYTSIKLYGKIGENPKCNSTDDIIEDINQNDTSISVENLECEEYYFCIQAITSDLTLSSNVVSIDLSFNWDGSEITILWSGDNNRMTAELIESNGNKHIKFRIYLGDTLIYQFIGQYVDESLSRTVKDINIGFLIDENNQIGRPSNIYYVSDQYATDYQKYIYNASNETPTESEMQDIYTWLVAGMD